MLARTLGDRLATIRQSVLLPGPRQVGKSTLLKGLRPQRTLNLADESLFLAYSKDPGPLRRERATNRRVSQRDRLLLFDIGVRNALVGQNRRPPLTDQRGALFEHWFILQVHSVRQLARLQGQWFSYRTEGGAEVDLVVETEDEIIGSFWIISGLRHWRGALPGPRFPHRDPR